MESLRRQMAKWPVPLWAALILSFAGYLILGLWFPLGPNFNLSPTLDVRALAPELWQGILYALLIAVLYGLYLLAVRIVSRHENGLSLTGVLLAAGAFCLPLLFTYPINATDIFRYFILNYKNIF